MDFEGNMLCVNNGNREQNGNSNNSSSFGWDLWEPTSSSSSNSTLINTFCTADTSTAVAPTRYEASLANALMFLPQATTAADRDLPERREPRLEGSHVHLDPNLVCLKLGKRHYFEDANAPLGGSGGVLAGKRERGYHEEGGVTVAATAAAATTVPRCQVEGCHVALLNAKDYHRRHKVCEMHSKAPKVVVLGLEQRFCQQCSRFHVVSEFDDSKRSCRRRLAGHNERRRKSFHESVARNSSQEKRLMIGGFPYLLSSSPSPPSSRCALSLLSSCKSDHPWFFLADLSTRCSAALRELIAKNRAATIAKQIILDRDWHPHHHHHHDLVAVEEDDGINKAIYPQSNFSFPQHHQMFL